MVEISIGIPSEKIYENLLFWGPWSQSAWENPTSASNQTIFLEGPKSFCFYEKSPLFTYLVVCPSVCLSVCATPQKSCITFPSLELSSPNFQGHLNSSQVIFGRVIPTTGPSGSGPDPEKWGLRQIYLLRGFEAGGVVSYLFGFGRTTPTKCWERNFDFPPSAK